ncbi:hypothetical protein GCM10010971_11210 [Silvimonas amylolytica]|uniref:Uncharacterized protein n=1 Tax=Silvimonas amylolytica TaxID=449663 RepID=A0ABQ2PI69_9NEIS|nr:hypothetical protein GCM10010971_11210 [Silvimonas amylolytica]
MMARFPASRGASLILGIDMTESFQVRLQIPSKTFEGIRKMRSGFAHSWAEAEVGGRQHKFALRWQPSSTRFENLRDA